MLRQISTFTRLELVNIFGINVFLNTRDAKEKKKKILLAAVLAFAIVMAVIYAGSIAYGLIYLEMSELVFSYMSILASILILFMGMFKAGAVIFNKNGYDIVSSLPVSKTAIVLSRYIRMYVENLLISAIVFLPSAVVYGYMVKPHFLALVYAVSGMLYIPLIPMSIATVLGALIAGISSRMKHKSVVESVLTVAFVVVVFAFMQSFGNVAGDMNLEMIRQMSGMVTEVFGKIYPPALWLGTAVSDVAFFKWFLYFGVSVACMLVCIVLVSAWFEVICRNLFGTSAKHNYEMQEQKAAGLGSALLEREIRRYFSSGVYVTNTIIGPVLGVGVAIAVFVMGVPKLTDMLKLPVALDIAGALPLAIGMIFCMMSMSCVSISMEGKNWWIAKSLPLDTRDILNAKIMANLVVFSPFYLVSEIFLLLALKPDFFGTLWVVSAPLLCCVFSAVFGITVNLALPLMNWDKEVSVVKQSASSVLGGIGGALVCLLLTFVNVVVPKTYTVPCRIGSCAILLVLSTVLYLSDCRRDLQKIE